MDQDGGGGGEAETKLPKCVSFRYTPEDIGEKRGGGGVRRNMKQSFVATKGEKIVEN